MEENKENKQQKHSQAESKRVETPQPPQRKDPMNNSEANRDGEASAENKSGAGAKDRKSNPAAQQEQEPPTTTTNRRSY